MKRALVLLMMALTAAGCSATPTSSTTEAASFQDCLRQEGITLPSNVSNRPTARPSVFPSARPSGGGARGGFGGDQAPAGVDPQKWQAAMEKCGSLRPSGNPSVNPSRGPRGDGRDGAYRNCLAEHAANPAEAAQVCAVLSPSPR